MKRPGGIYMGTEGRRYLAMYNYNHDISVRLPPELQSAERVAAISYSKGGKEGGVDVFLLPSRELPIEERVRLKKTISRSEEGYRIIHNNGKIGSLSKIIVNETGLPPYDIKATIIEGFPKDVELDVIALTSADIAYFCENNIATKFRPGPSIQKVPSIIPKTSIKKINPERVLTGGKAEFVPQCVLEANIDFTKGCLTSWVPGENASFDGESSTDYWHFPWGDCDYCYALDKHRAFPKTIYEFDKQRLLEELKGGARLIYGSNEPSGKSVEILRFGKRTEPWTPFTEDSFVGTLETMLETRTKGVITTKFLPFNSEIAELLKKTKSTVLYSVGGTEEVELGPLAWGATNQFRMEQAAKYRESKVNVALFYLIHPSFAPTKQDLSQHEFIDNHKLLTQYIGARFYRKEDAQKMIAPLAGLGENPSVSIWEILKGNSVTNHNQISFTEEYWFAGSYEEHAGILIPRLDRIHPFWRERIGRNVGKTRICAHDAKETFCGGCFTKPGTISPTIESTGENPVFVKLTFGKKGRGNNRPKGDKNQTKLGL